MAIRIAVFVVHVVLLVLASTNFTILTAVFGDTALNWNYFTYAYRDGFGFEYRSDFNTAQTVAYLLAYAFGLPVFAVAWQRGWKFLSGVGIVLCVLGLISFSIEASHWLISHHLSWIASFPIVMAFLWVMWAVMLYRTRCVERNHRGQSMV